MTSESKEMLFCSLSALVCLLSFTLQFLSTCYPVYKLCAAYYVVWIFLPHSAVFHLLTCLSTPRVKRVTKMSEKVANGVLSGVVKVSGFFTSSVVNSKAGKKFFGLLPGEIVLASLDGFGTTHLKYQHCRYGDQAAEITHEGLDAAGHAFGTAWAVFKIRKALNPKSAMKPSALAKAAASDLRAKQGK
ncbi:hypothetical protein BHE74_00022070 [Ensete ventricosum]|nr:hypothetical protein GW17_00029342 [Ensete ventricosum]RWW70259.1 hypothetical protein BHE74_00022070 [Ensete ventricosum]RZS18421.1 hypothetical protein BHM03_00050682 [Ensete ventricosum]